jgi:Tfx family DNA-binding protein
MTEDPDHEYVDAGGGGQSVDALLDRLGFDAETSVLTRRQAEVLALRERGYTQAEIATRFGTSRANVASVEASARENVAAARETVAFADALDAPVQVTVPADTDLYAIPELVFDAADGVDITVAYTDPELVSRLREAAGDAIVGREVRHDLLVSVTTGGDVRVRRQADPAT